MLTAQAQRATGLRIEIEGAVQGVGFRPWVHALAREAALGGRVWNDSGNVTVEAFGEPEPLARFVERLRRPPMPAARVRDLRCREIPVERVAAFEIVSSRATATRRPSIPPDLATCADCLRELRDPSDRRHGYAFINCTRCGPRYTICEDVPYDRARTTMATFEMCDACRAEYESPSDRRFHAQPDACPVCGPRLTLVDDAGLPIAGDAVEEAARSIERGAVVAVKGVGGYHLACDATSALAVATLRARKHRDAKPFAVMVASLDDAERVALLSDAERTLLAQPSRPIVLVERRERVEGVAALADDIAPGSPMVGLMLPYTPLHELLLARVGRPIVLTSGNLSDEPMACDDDDALRRLGREGGGIADAILRHDRPIANRCDDSVARVIGGRPVVLRRGRGWVPAGLSLRREVPRPVLACGGHLKNAFCLAAGTEAWLGPHVGDLETDEACADFERMVERFARFVGIEPEIVAHDLHPDYFTTRWAMEHAAGARVAVQHHHAHAASAIAEHAIEGPVIALAWDGTGYGSDGTAWGGELLVADLAGFRRLGTFRPIALAGGDVAVREVWRVALALLDDAFDGDPPLEHLRLFDAIGERRIDGVRRMIASGLNAPEAHGVGRYFDAFGALALGRTEARYEGEIATRLALAADPGERRPYPFDVIDERATARASIDLRPALRDTVVDLIAGRSVATVSGRLHATLVAAAEVLVGTAREEVGLLPVALTGGCFQNPRLVEDISGALARRHRVLLHGDVPPNDGGIALGQALVAGAVLRGELSVVGGKAERPRVEGD